MIGLLLSAVLGAIGIPFWWLVPAAYGVFLAVAAITESIRRRDRAAALLPLVMPTMHLAWGTGFLLVRTRR